MSRRKRSFSWSFSSRMVISSRFFLFFLYFLGDSGHRESSAGTKCIIRSTPSAVRYVNNAVFHVPSVCFSRWTKGAIFHTGYSVIGKFLNGDCFQGSVCRGRSAVHREGVSEHRSALSFSTICSVVPGLMFCLISWLMTVW